MDAQEEEAAQEWVIQQTSGIRRENRWRGESRVLTGARVKSGTTQ